MIPIAFLIASNGQCFGNVGSFLIPSSQSHAWSVFILVYIESASAVKSLAVGGRLLIFLMKLMTVPVSCV